MKKFRKILKKRETSVDAVKASHSSRKFFSSNFFKVFAVLVLVVGVFFLLNRSSKDRSGVRSSTDIREIGDPIASQTINREFTFPIRDASQEQLGEIKYEIVDAQIRDEIIIKGKRYAAVDGRTFVIVSVKITNEFDQAIEINSRNYVRLGVNGEEEWLAPDTHNDPVQVQAISTKPTRIGFTVDQNSQDLILQVGEIKGEKTKIELEIKPE